MLSNRALSWISTPAASSPSPDLQWAGGGRWGPRRETDYIWQPEPFSKWLREWGETDWHWWDQTWTVRCNAALRPGPSQAWLIECDETVTEQGEQRREIGEMEGREEGWPGGGGGKRERNKFENMWRMKCVCGGRRDGGVRGEGGVVAQRNVFRTHEGWGGGGGRVTCEEARADSSRVKDPPAWNLKLGRSGWYDAQRKRRQVCTVMDLERRVLKPIGSLCTLELCSVKIVKETNTKVCTRHFQREKKTLPLYYANLKAWDVNVTLSEKKKKKITFLMSTLLQNVHPVTKYSLQNYFNLHWW